MDDLKSSHVDPKVNDEFMAWTADMYGDDEIGKYKAVRCKRHDYLAMTLDYTVEGEVKIDMTDYIKAAVEEFPNELKGACVAQPWNP